MVKEQQTIYVSPKVRTVEIKAQAIICQSVTGGFGVSNNGNVERGDDSDWD